MYQVLLVDDESAVTTALQKSIDWNSMDMVVASVCRSGRQALDFIGSHHVDIVITDIRMADMDGLSLCQEIHQSRQNVQIIVISGFAEFSYAKKAMSFGVLGYCLKPIEYSELARYLQQASDRLEPNPQHNDGNFDDLLAAIYSGSSTELALQLSRFGFTDKQYYVAASVSRLPLFSQNDQILPLQIGYQRYCYISMDPIIPDKLEPLFSRCKCRGFSLTNTSVPLRALGAAIKRLTHNAFNYFVDSSKIVFPDGERKRQSFPHLPEFEKCVTKRDTKQLLVLLKQTLDLPTGTISLRGAWELYHLISTDEFYRPVIVLEDLYTIEQMVITFQSFDKMIADICTSLEDAMSSQPQKTLSNSTFLQMVKLINAHLTDDYSLRQLADEMHMNANYLGQVFKKEAGQTFTSYVTALRIERAKQMLISRDMSISSVASSLGFNDYFYFLKTFKRIVGVTPKQYILAHNNGINLTKLQEECSNES